ncbi:MAG: glycosyltransferase family 4 protein [Flavobacteriales bacterium]|jgi:glycosyltransferase involved in cell wall biosynthesis|nr:glycosyltransferase family 4 protein [Flavobacteriales bacterium]
MKIVINTRLLIKDKLEGIGWFTFETLKRITQAHPEHQFYFLFDRKYDASFIFSDNITPVVLSPQARHPILFKIWFNWSVHRFLKKINADLFVSPDGYLSLPTKVPQVAVMHDLNFEHYPEFLPKHITKYYTTYFPLFAKKATKIITVSHFSKQDIVNQYGINPQKIAVVYNGINQRFAPLNVDLQNQIRKQYTNGAPFFIYVGSLNPRKNIENTLRAFDLFKKQNNTNHKFVIVGEKLWSNKSIEACYNSLEYQADILFTGRLFNEDLGHLLASAAALLYISYFEGFGIPIIEAMQCGTPVITSTQTSLPEVAGDAAILCDPNAIDTIAQQMNNILDDQLRSQYINKGFENAKRFNWDTTATELWSAIEAVLKTLKK